MPFISFDEEPSIAEPKSTFVDFDAPDKPVEQTGVINELGRGFSHGAQVTLPKSIGQAAKFFGAEEIGNKMVADAAARETNDNQESAYGRSLDSPYSVRGNVFEAADNSVLSVAPGAAGAAVGAGIGAAFAGVGAVPGALIGYGIGSLASLPIFYGSQGQQSYEKIKEAQRQAGALPDVAEREAVAGGHQAGAIEAGGELIADIIPFAKMFKPFVKPAAKVGGTLVKDMFYPTLKQAGKTILQTEAGEVITEMGQQAGEDAVEAAHGAGPGATWDSTSRVIMPTALMSLIPGMAGSATKHAQVNASRKALEDPDTPAEVRSKLAMAAVKEMSAVSEDTARSFSLYAGKQIEAGQPISIMGDSFYKQAAAGINTPAPDPITAIGIGNPDIGLDEAVAAASAIARGTPSSTPESTDAGLLNAINTSQPTVTTPTGVAAPTTPDTLAAPVPAGNADQREGNGAILDTTATQPVGGTLNQEAQSAATNGTSTEIPTAITAANGRGLSEPGTGVAAGMGAAGAAGGALESGRAGNPPDGGLVSPAAGVNAKAVTNQLQDIENIDKLATKNVANVQVSQPQGSINGITSDQAQPQQSKQSQVSSPAAVAPTSAIDDLLAEIASIKASKAVRSTDSQTTADKRLTPVSQRIVTEPGKQVSSYPGKYGKGMNQSAAKLKAFELNRAKSDKTITYSAEEHNNPALENPWAVIGRKVATPEAVQPAARAEPQSGNHLGRDNTPLSEGGKPFKTKSEASHAKRLQPMLRVIRVDGGFALAEKTQAQIDAQDKAARRLALPKTSPPNEAIPAHAMIAAAGGLAPSERSDMGIEGNIRIGNRSLFAAPGRGLTMERATKKLIEDGYLPPDALHEDARRLIRKGLNDPQYTPEGTERMAEAQMAQDFQDHLEAQKELPSDDPFAPLLEHEYQPEDAQGTGFHEATPEIKAEVAALSSLLDSMGIDSESVRMDISEQHPNATDQEYHELTKAALQSAVEEATLARSHSDSGADHAEQGKARSSEGLTSPTKQDVLDQQAQAEAEKQRQQDGGDKAVERKVTGDQIDLLNPQAGVFDAPVKPLSEMSPADHLRAAADKMDYAAAPKVEPTQPSAQPETKPGPGGTQEPLKATLSMKDGTLFDMVRTSMGRFDFIAGDGTKIGSMIYTDYPMTGGFKASGISVDPAYQRKGVATAAYNFIEKNVTGKIFESAGGQSPSGAAFRAARKEANEPAAKPELPEGVSSDVVSRLADEVASAKDAVATEQEKSNRLHASDNIPGAFTAGRSNYTMGRQREAMNNRLSAQYDKLVAAEKRLTEAENTLAGYRSGERHENGQPRANSPSRVAGNAAVASYADFIRATVKAGDKVVFTPNPSEYGHTVVRLNQKTVTLEGGATWGYDNIRPWVDGKAVPAKETMAAFKAWREQKAQPEAKPADTGTAMFSQSGQSTPAERTLPVNEANREKTDQLQKALKGRDATVTPVSVPVDAAGDGGRGAGGRGPSNSFSLAEKLAGIFGKKVVWITTEGSFSFNGVVVGGGKLSNEIFVNANSPIPVHVILGHELTHHIEFDAPGIYKALVKSVEGLLRNHEGYRQRYSMQDSSDLEVTKEMIGDLMGDNFGKREFWNRVSQESSNGLNFKMIARSVTKWLDSLLTKLKLKGFGSDQFVSNIHAARKALAQAVADYAESRGVPARLNDGSVAPAFNRGTNEPMTQKDVVGNQGGRSAEAVRAGDVYRAPSGEAVTVMRTLPGGKVEVRIQGNRTRLGDFTNNELKAWLKIGRADYSDGAYTTPKSLIDLAKNEPTAPESGGAQTKYSRSLGTTLNAAADNVPAETGLQAKQRVVQDKFNRFQVLQTWLKEQGVDLSEAADVYLAETLMSGRISSRKQDFREKQMGPLIKKTQAAGFSLEQVVEFLKAQHAPEANKRAQEIHSDPEATAFGVTDQEARDTLDEFQKLPDFNRFKDIADEWRGITDQTKKILLDGGILSQEMVAAWEAAYSLYIPVKGTEEKTGTGKGLSVNGKTKRRLGHALRDEAIIENILRDHERAISLDEKNLVGKALIRFGLEAKNDDILTIGKPIKRQVLKPGQAHYMVTYRGSDVSTFDNLNDARRHIADAVAKNQGNKAEFDVEKTSDPARVMLQASPMLGDNEVTVYVGGNAVRIQINDEIAARAYTNLGVEHLNTILSAGREANNWLSKVYTGYSPDFIFTNPLRDATQGFITLTGEHGAGMAARIFGHYPRAVKELIKHFAKPGSSDLVTDYRAHGGSTGAAYLSDLERIGNDMQNAYNEYAGVTDTYNRTYQKAIDDGRKESTAMTLAALKAGISGIKEVPVIGHFLKLMERINSVTENALRVATYDTLVKSGMSKARAAAQAKGLMNFNRKGEISNQAGALYLFFNPNVQGSQVMYRALVESEHKGQARALAGMMVLAAMALAEMGMSGGDDEEEKWKNTPSYLKDGNWIIGFGDYQVTLTLPYGYRVFHMLGNVMSEYAHGADGYKLGIRLASGVFANFSPIGNPMEGNLPGFQLFPTVPKMAIGPSVNENSFGQEIGPKRWNSAKPDSQMMYRSTKGSIYSSAAEGVNRLTGGSKYEKGAVDVSPETLKFWVKSLTGGAGQAAFDMVSVPSMIAQGVAPEPRDIPIARRFARKISINDARSAFWERAKEASQAADAFSAAKRAHDAQGVQEIIKENRALLQMSKYADHAQKMAGSRRDAIDAIKLDDNLTLKQKHERMKVIEAQEEAVYTRFIRAFDAQTKPKTK